MIRIIITSLIKLYEQRHSWGIIQDGQTPEAYAFEPSILKQSCADFYRFVHTGGWESMLSSFCWWCQVQKNSPERATFISIFLFSQTIWLFCLGCGAGSSTQGEHEQSSLPTNTNSPGSKVSPCLVPGLLLIFHYHKIGVIILVAITLPFCLVISWSHSKLLYRMIRSKRNKGIFTPFTEIIYIHHLGPTGPFKGILRAVYPSKP